MIRLVGDVVIGWWRVGLISSLPLYHNTWAHSQLRGKNKEKGRTGKRKREKQRENKERQRDRKGGKEGRPHHTREQAEERKRKRAVSIATGYQW